MNLRKLTSWFPELSYRQKVVSLILSGVIVGLGGLFFYLLRMQTYLIGDDPAACVNCHIMTPYGSVLKPSCKPILLSTQFHKPI